MTTSPENWACPRCNAQFSRKWTMMRHMGRKVCREEDQEELEDNRGEYEDNSKEYKDNLKEGNEGKEGKEGKEVNEVSPYLSPNPGDWPPMVHSRLQRMEGFNPSDESVTAWKRRTFFKKKKTVPEDHSKSPHNRTLVNRRPSSEDRKVTIQENETETETETENIHSILRSLQEDIKQLREEKSTSMVPRDQTGSGCGGANGNGQMSNKEGEEAKEPKIDIVCLAKGDYIKKLIQLHDGDEEKAMNYIKNIGIAADFLEGDFRMIKKIYFDGKKKSQFPIRVKDYKRNKLEYLEENGEWILDIRGEIVGKRLCENIVSTLLIANTQFNEVIINEEDEVRKELLLDLFQINKTQAHIMKLLERKTQGKLSRRVAEFINYCTEVQAETGSLDNVKKAY